MFTFKRIKHLVVYCSNGSCQGDFQTKLLQYMLLPLNMLALKLTHVCIFLCGYFFFYFVALQTFHSVCSFALYLI